MDIEKLGDIYILVVASIAVLCVVYLMVMLCIYVWMQMFGGM